MSEQKSLKKGLGLLDVFGITTGAMLSSGLFLLPGLAHAKAGPAIFISYLIAGLLATIGMLSQAELASAMPKSGGAYYYVTRSMGQGVGTVYGLITFLSLSLKSAFELVGMATFAKIIFEVIYLNPLADFYLKVIAAFLCLVFVGINFFGVKMAGKIQVFLVLIILPVLFFYVIVGFPKINFLHFQSFIPYGFNSILATAGFVFVSYGGLLKVASLAEEVKDPGKILPRGMILSLLVVILCYSLVILVTIGLLKPSELNTSLTPLSDGAYVSLGLSGSLLMSFLALLAFSSAANAGIMGASRYPLALSRDKLLPPFFGRIHEKYQIPYNAVISVGIIMLITIFFDLDLIIKAASTVLILTYIFSCLANVIMRESRLQNYQPKFKAPWYPWLQIIGFLGFIFILIEIGLKGLIVTLIFITIGFFIYWFYGRIRSNQEYALLHLIERITAKELTNNSLETELKEVIRERDEIIMDRFDNLIEEATVLDLEEEMSLDDLFSLIAETLNSRLQMSKEDLGRLLIDREKESSTALSPDFAIPHIIIYGQKIFDILLIRSKAGVAFSEIASKVQAIFVLVGTKDERNFHLQSLAAIAQIIQDPDFYKKWMAAKNKNSLKDLILLGQRRR